MMKQKINIAITPSSFGVSDESKKIVNEYFDNVIINQNGRRLNKKETLDILKDCHGVIAGLEVYDEEIFKKCPNLKAISRVGIGIDNIDLQSANHHNIKILNTPDEPAFAVAEMTLSMMLFMIKKINFFNDNTHSLIWEKSITSSLNQANILIVGYGRIGKKLHSLLEPFNANIFISDPQYTNHPNYIDLNDGIQIADIISLNAATKKTIFGKEEFQLLKKGVIILNPSRDILIDSNLVIDYSNKGIIQGAWFDAFSNEPYSGDMIGKKNIYLTPHISTYTDVCRRDMELKATKNLISFFEKNEN